MHARGAVLAMLAVAATYLTGVSPAGASADPTLNPTLYIAGYGTGESGNVEALSESSDCHGTVSEPSGPGIPLPYLVEPGTHLGRITLGSNQHPARATLTASPISNNGLADGRTTHLGTTIVHEGGSAATWLVRFHIPVAAAQSYLLTVDATYGTKCNGSGDTYIFNLRGARS